MGENIIQAGIGWRARRLFLASSGKEVSPREIAFQQADAAGRWVRGVSMGRRGRESNKIKKNREERGGAKKRDLGVQ